MRRSAPPTGGMASLERRSPVVDNGDHGWLHPEKAWRSTTDERLMNFLDIVELSVEQCVSWDAREAKHPGHTRDARRRRSFWALGHASISQPRRRLPLRVSPWPAGAQNRSKRWCPRRSLSPSLSR